MVAAQHPDTCSESGLATLHDAAPRSISDKFAPSIPPTVTSNRDKYHKLKSRNDSLLEHNGGG